MTKDKIKDMLESYKFEHQFYIEKCNELEKIKENYLKTIKILKEFNRNKNKKMIDDIILGYTKDLIQHETYLAKLKEHIKEVEFLLNNVSQPYRTVLYYKYIQRLSIEEIADKMNYSTQTIYQLHDIGINQIIEKQDKEDAM